MRERWLDAYRYDYVGTGRLRPSTTITALTDLSLDLKFGSTIVEVILGIVIVVTKRAKAQGRVYLLICLESNYRDHIQSSNSAHRTTAAPTISVPFNIVINIIATAVTQC
jgi:hypothetical protein